MLAALLNFQGEDIVTPSGNQMANRENKHEPKFFLSCDFVEMFC